MAQDLGVPERLREGAPAATGRSVEMLVESERVLASVCEALIGAAYLCFGIERTAPAVVESFAEEIDDALEHPVDYKSVLQERLARRRRWWPIGSCPRRGRRTTAVSSPWPRSAGRSWAAGRERRRRAPSRTWRLSKLWTGYPDD